MKLAFIFETGDGLENNAKTMPDEPTAGTDGVCSSYQLSQSHHDIGDARSEHEEPKDTSSNSAWAEPLHTAIEFLTRQHDEHSHTHDQREQEPPATQAPLSPIFSSPSTSASHCTELSAPPITALTQREAILIQHFISNISPWLDVCDDVPRFAKEVPMRATKSPMLLFSILAASSRHQALQDDTWQEASDYHSKCLELVIKALSQPKHCYNEILLTTIVCLRLYEMFSHQIHSYLHLDGMACLLGAIPDFLQSGGLAETAAWLALRQDVFIAMINKQAPKFRLEDYDRSSVFKRRADSGTAAYAIMLIWAKVLRHIYSTNPDGISTTWSGLQDTVRKWYHEKGFQPIFQQDANAYPDQPFPIINMISAPQVVALEYYHTCQVYLHLHKPSDTWQATPKLVEGDRNQAAMHSLCSIIGLARSNTWVEYANFPACHILLMCGHRITNQLQRDHALQFLDHIQTDFGYRCDEILLVLKRQWAEFDASKD